MQKPDVWPVAISDARQEDSVLVENDEERPNQPQNTYNWTVMEEKDHGALLELTALWLLKGDSQFPKRC